MEVDINKPIRVFYKSLRSIEAVYIFAMNQTRFLAFLLGLLASTGLASAVKSGDEAPIAPVDEASSSQGRVGEITSQQVSDEVLQELREFEKLLDSPERQSTIGSWFRTSSPGSDILTRESLNELIEKYKLIRPQGTEPIPEGQTLAELLIQAGEINELKCSKSFFLLHHSLMLKYSSKPQISSFLEELRSNLIHFCVVALETRLVQVAGNARQLNLDLLISMMHLNDIREGDPGSSSEQSLSAHKLEQALARFARSQSIELRVGKPSKDRVKFLMSLRREIDEKLQPDCLQLQQEARREVESFKQLAWFVGSDDSRIKSLLMFRNVIIKTKICDMLNVAHPEYNNKRVFEIYNYSKVPDVAKYISNWI